MRRFAPVRSVKGENPVSSARLGRCESQCGFKMESKVTGSFARPDRSHYFAIAFAIVLISFSSAFATKLRCRDLATADADELLAIVDRQSVRSGGGVQVGKYDCDPGGQSGCTWETTLEDDRMLDRDHRLIYVLS